MRHNILKNILMALAVAACGTLTSCDLTMTQEKALDPLKGIYPAPEELTIVSAANAGTEKTDKNRLFSVDFTTAEGDVLAMKLVGDKYFLQAAAFTPAESAEVAKKGNYICSESTFTRKGGSPANVTKGVLTVENEDANYAVKGALWLSDGNIIKVKGGGTLLFEPDPEPVKLSKVLSCQDNNGQGTKSLTINLASDEVTSSFDMTTYQTKYEGNGNFVALDIYSADGKLHPGTYTACATGGQIGEGEFGIGWDPGDLWGVGMIFSNWGTCWWTVENGATSAVHITEGEIEVALSGSKYTISYKQPGVPEKDAIWFEFKGAIEGVVPSDGPAEPDYIELTKVLSATDNNANGTKSVTLNLSTDGVVSTPNAYGGADITGEGNYLAVDLYSEDGKINAGTYKASAVGGQVAAGEFGIGWDPGDLWGIGMVFSNWGTCWWTVAEEGNSAIHITEGEINVSVKGDDIVITYVKDDFAVRFKGTVEGFGGVEGDFSTGGGSSEPEVEYIEISNFLSAAVNNGTTLSLQLAGEGISTAPNAYGGKDVTGDGNYLKIDLYTTDGTLAEGVYTPVENTALAEGNFAMGYDPGDMWGIGIEFKNWGTAWMTREGDTETGVNITDGTIKVTKSGDNYVIALESSVVNVRYTGPITFSAAQ